MSTVLYIEDNPDNVELVDRVCEALGYKMLVAINGALGLAMAEASLPDLILLDINLPDMDGYEIARRLRAHPLTQVTPIVAVTANALKGDSDRAMEAGCNDYVAKPVIIGDLRKKMARFLTAQN